MRTPRLAALLLVGLALRSPCVSGAPPSSRRTLEYELRFTAAREPSREGAHLECD